MSTRKKYVYFLKCMLLAALPVGAANMAKQNPPFKKYANSIINANNEDM
jgi:hypothetical protein